MSDGTLRESELPEVVIRPPAELLRLDFRELYRYRHMLAALVRRNTRSQFDEMSFGIVWACLRPLLYVLVFAALRKLSNADLHVAIPYALYVYSGLILWYYLIESITETANAVRADAHLMTKVYYPRLITPMVPAIANLSGLALSGVPLIAMMAWFGVVPGWRVALLPFVLLQCMILVFGVGTMFAAAAVRTRDWERFLTFVLYVGLFLSPVIYAPAMIPGWAHPVYFANPAAGTLLAFRSALFAVEPFPLGQWVYSCVVSLVVLFIGVRMYRVAEMHFADEL
ncbi:MAG: ABC transporter permease [Candidatus Rokuibacteriota bacterium]